MPGVCRVFAATGLLATLGCSGGEGTRPLQDFVGLWQATSGSLQQVCNGVQTTPPFTPYLISLQSDGSGHLSRSDVDTGGAATDPCPWQYVSRGNRAVLDGKQSCAVVTGPTVATTIWLEDTLTLSEDLQTLEQQGTSSDATGCTTSVDVHHARQGGAGGAGDH